VPVVDIDCVGHHISTVVHDFLRGGLLETLVALAESEVLGYKLIPDLICQPGDAILDVSGLERALFELPADEAVTVVVSVVAADAA
jgi:hypothetical protein